MSGRNNNKLPSNLPQLQNLIKRDPPAYIEEVGRGPGSLESSGGFRVPREERGRGEGTFLRTCFPPLANQPPCGPHSH